MHIAKSSCIPDNTFLVARDVEPVYHEAEERLTIYTGTGPQYSWGTTVVVSTIVLHAEDLVAVHVRFCHRYGTRECWRYWQRHGEHWGRVMWNSLVTSERLRIFEAYQQEAPAFAVLPGSLPGKSRTAAPSMKIGFTYLLARVQGEKYYALKYPGIEYVLGTPCSTDRTLPARVSSYPCRTCLLIKWRTGTLSRDDLPPTLALLECSVSGNVSLSRGKVISSSLCPQRVVEVVTLLR